MRVSGALTNQPIDFCLEAKIFRLGEDFFLLFPGAILGKTLLKKSDQFEIAFALAGEKHGGDNADAETKPNQAGDQDDVSMRGMGIEEVLITRLTNDHEDHEKRAGQSAAVPGLHPGMGGFRDGFFGG